MSNIKNISGESLAYLASTIAIAISREFDLSDVNILSGFFTAIGDSLAILASQAEAIRSANEVK